MNAASLVNQARRAAGLSQRELARRAGVPQSAIARIERGQQVPRYDTLVRILDPCGFELRLHGLAALPEMLPEREAGGWT